MRMVSAATALTQTPRPELPRERNGPTGACHPKDGKGVGWPIIMDFTRRDQASGFRRFPPQTTEFAFVNAISSSTCVNAMQVTVSAPP